MSSSRTSALMPIGSVARRTGLEVSAIRYYEEAGLIPPPRRVGGKRMFDDSVFEAIALVRLAQDAGFTLAEARELVSGFEKSTPASARWQTMARRKLVDVTERIERAQRMKEVLERLLRCRCETLGQCVRARTEALIAAGEVAGRPSRRRA
jgi:MerR family transcriptional regulator, redox-sensitive transcriptional activator SoxR